MTRFILDICRKDYLMVIEVLALKLKDYRVIF